MKKAFHNCPTVEIKDGKFVKVIDRRDVIVLSIVGIWAMVRRPYCKPYACEKKELEFK